jgi:hypothetical protein
MDIRMQDLNGMNDFISKPFEEDKPIKAILRQVEESDIRTTAIPRRKTGYSLDALREGSGGNTGFVREMVHLFLKNTESGLTELQGMLDSGSGQQPGDLIHKISGPIRHSSGKAGYAHRRKGCPAGQPGPHDPGTGPDGFQAGRDGK